MENNPSKTAWLSIQNPNPEALVRLFCFPYAGGGPHVFRNWSDLLPPGVEVCAVQLPGRGGRMSEPPYKRIPPLVEALSQALSPFFDKPFAFFGHSLGALISFETARQLRRELKASPARLFVSGRRAPQIPREYAIYNLPEREFLSELKRLNGTPAQILEDPDLMRIMMPVLRADFEIVGTYAYTPESPLEIPISVFGGLNDGEAERAELEAWREQTTTDFSLRMFAGDHFFIHTARSSILWALWQQLHHLLKEAN